MPAARHLRTVRRMQKFPQPSPDTISYNFLSSLEYFLTKMVGNKSDTLRVFSVTRDQDLAFHVQYQATTTSCLTPNYP